MKKLKVHLTCANHDPTASTTAAPFKIFSRSTTAAIVGQAGNSTVHRGPTGGVGMSSAIAGDTSSLFVTA